MVPFCRTWLAPPCCADAYYLRLLKYQGRMIYSYPVTNYPPRWQAAAFGTPVHFPLFRGQHGTLTRDLALACPFLNLDKGPGQPLDRRPSRTMQSSPTLFIIKDADVEPLLPFLDVACSCATEVYRIRTPHTHMMYTTRA